MDRDERFVDYLLAVLLAALGWSVLSVFDESRDPTLCLCFGLLCLAIAYFAIGYVSGRG